MPVGPSIEHEINVKASASTVHDAIATRAGLQGWNTSRVTGDGAVGTEWTLSYAGGPDFVWRVDRDDASGVRWTCTRGPGDSVGTTVEFALAPTQDATRLAAMSPARRNERRMGISSQKCDASRERKTPCPRRAKVYATTLFVVPDRARSKKARLKGGLCWSAAGYRRLPQKRWMRLQASSRSEVFVA